MWQFYCSWPISPLWPSSNSPPRMRQRALNEQRQEAHLIATRSIPVEERRRLSTTRIKLKLQFVKPNCRLREEAEMIESSQYLIRGVAEAIGTDVANMDPEYDFTPEPMKPGGIRVVIQEAEKKATQAFDVDMFRG